MATHLRGRRLTTTKRSKLRYAAEKVFKCLRFLEYLFYPSNNALCLTRMTLELEALPTAFDALRIVQVSDLHGKSFGRDNVKLLDAIRSSEPDLILVTGDLLDERHFFLDQTRRFLNALVEIAPVYYVIGNHEADLKEEYREEVFALVRDAGVRFLRDEAVLVTRGDASIKVVGLHDPIFSDPYFETVDKKLQALDAKTPPSFRLLLAHRPEGFPLYVKYGYDLVFSGHAHGGQFRLPCVCPEGLNAPGQGWLPRYTSGAHRDGRTTMVVSRGLGPSVIPTRLFNRPELILCVLRSKTSTAADDV